MNFSDLVNRVNIKLAGDTLVYSNLRPHFDDVIDEINESLHALFPTFSELPADVTAYTAFPDKYQRTVLVYGTVVKYYAMDDEGYQNMNDYYVQQYNKHMFTMIRDYISSVPAEYLAPDTEGYLTGDPLNDAGVWLEGGETASLNG